MRQAVDAWLKTPVAIIHYFEQSKDAFKDGHDNLSYLNLAMS